MTNYTIMGIFAHPDDETFGPGATLAKYAAAGHNVVVLSATRGQVGQASGMQIDSDLGTQREAELREAAQILGVGEVEFLDFFDGGLNEHQLPLLKSEVERQVQKYQPDVVITYEPLGISRHLDHIAISKAVTQVYDEQRISPQKLYYFGFPRRLMKQMGRYGGLDEEQLARIDITETLETKKKAMWAYRTQARDVERLLKRYEQPDNDKSDFNYEYFELVRTSLADLSFPEDDLLAGL